MSKPKQPSSLEPQLTNSNWPYHEQLVRSWEVANWKRAHKQQRNLANAQQFFRKWNRR